MRWIRSLATVLISLLALSAPVGAATPAKPSENGVQIGGLYVQPAVDLLKRLAIVSGDPDGRMRLFDTINRAELAKVVVSAMGQDEAAAKALAEAPAFPDVKEHWARGYIAIAKQAGIAGGYEDGSFRPGNLVTHAEALTMLLRTSGLRPAGPWPNSYLDAAREAGVLTDSLDRALPPKEQASRAAVFLLAERSFTRVTDAAGTSLLQRAFKAGTPAAITVFAKGAESGSTALAEVPLTINAPGAVMVQVNGRSAVFAGQTFTATAALLPGLNEIMVIAEDDLGTYSSTQIRIIRR